MKSDRIKNWPKAERPRERLLTEGVEKLTEAELLAIAIDLFNSDHPNAQLSPKRIDKQHGASYEIPSRVFQEIEQSRLVIADLTDEKQNVYCEVGYAKAKNIPFILTFQKKRKGPSENRVHFDLAPYRYIEYDNPLDLRDRLKKELDVWFQNM